MKLYAVRELLKITAQPDMISFAGGLPAEELFPLERCQIAAQTVLQRHGRQALQYGPTEGLPELRDWVARRFAALGMKLGRENVAIVSGAQQGLDLIGRVLLNPGDRVVVENPTYLALLSAWRPLGVQFLPTPCDGEGLRVEDLKPLLELEPKLIYTIPNFQNPQGTSLSRARRQELTQLLAGRPIAVVEDDPYGDLRYEGEPLPHLTTLLALDHSINSSSGIYLGTFSKTLMPGLRVGWVVAPEPVIDKIVQAKQSADLQTSTFNQHLVCKLIEDDFLDRHIPFLREQYRARRDAMLAALESHLPKEVTWNRPEGGMFLLLTLPKTWDATPLLSQALASRVAFVPGEEFHPDGSGKNTLRLNFTHSNPGQIEEGIRRLGKIMGNFGF